LWREAVDAQMSRMNIDRSSRRLSNFQNNLADIKSQGQNKLQRERERLMRQYEAICSEIKTCENNIGFFTSSKNSGAKLLQEMQRNIDKLKEDRDLIIKKIQMIDED
jgi:archaellum component FlaC